MCWRSASEYRLYAGASSEPVRTISKPPRSLMEVLRDLLRPRRPEEAEAKVVLFPARGDVDTGRAANHKGPEAA
jgi:hypothetical protein